MANNNEKVILEFEIDLPQRKLYEFLTEPYHLRKWFAEEVAVKDTDYSFTWDGAISRSCTTEKKKNKFIKFNWKDAPEEFLELRIESNEITDDIALVVTDFILPKDKEDHQLMWKNQIECLRDIMLTS